MAPFFIMIQNSILLVILIFTCSIFQENEILFFEYEASTRGSFKKVILRKDSTFVFDQEKETKTITEKKDWKFLNQKIAELDLKKLELFKALSEERYSDQALSAKLLVNKNNRTYESTVFDHGNPPDEIKHIVDVLARYLSSE